MLFKNILKLSGFLLFASSCYCYGEDFTGECKEINEYLVENFKKNMEGNDDTVYVVNPLNKCKTNSKGKVIEMELISRRNDKETIEKALNHDTITKLDYEILIYDDEATYGEFPSIITKLTNLEELTLKYDNTDNDNNFAQLDKSIKADVLNLSSKKLKTLNLKYIKINSDIISQISKLTTLKNLSISTDNNSLLDYYDELKNLKNIKLSINGKEVPHYTGDCKEIEKFIMENTKKNLYEDDNSLFSFNSLRECETNSKGEVTKMYLISERNDKETLGKALSYNTLTNLTYFINDEFYQREPSVFSGVPTAITKLTNLEYLKLDYYYEYFNSNTGDYIEYDKEIDKDLFKLSSKKLKTLVLDRIKLTDDVISQIDKLSSLENLIIFSATDKKNSNIKMAKKINNIPNIFVDGEKVKSNSSTSNPISTDGKCGKDNGNTVCPSEECCSKYGYCGTSDKHCNSGCQSEFGKCKGTSNTTTTTTKTNTITNPTSTNGKCGKDNGNTVCPSGQCCSKYGYCGTSDKHCNSGCQSEFGKCNNSTTTTTTTTTKTTTKTTKTTKKSKSTSTNGKCGKDNGNTVCPSGQCCSKYGYCGTSDAHCYSGCQSEFGKCK